MPAPIFAGMQICRLAKSKFWFINCGKDAKKAGGNASRFKKNLSNLITPAWKPLYRSCSQEQRPPDHA